MFQLLHRRFVLRLADELRRAIRTLATNREHVLQRNWLGEHDVEAFAKINSSSAIGNVAGQFASGVFSPDARRIERLNALGLSPIQRER